MRKKVILFGCQAISIDILRFLSSRADVDILKVVTYEVLSDVSRGQESVKTVAADLGIEVLSPRRISQDLVEQIRILNPDLIISAYYRKIFPQELIEIPLFGILNIHPSMLPYYRGPVPTAWAILNNESEFGITVHKVDTGIDTGDILVQSRHDIGDDETGYELYLRAMALGAKLLIDNFDKIITSRIQPIKQESGGSYYGKLESRVFLDWKQSAQKIKNSVRIRSHPYNPIETILENKYFFINKVSIDKSSLFPIQVPGKILQVNSDGTFLVSCSDGAVLIEDYSVYPAFTGVEKAIYLQPGRSFDER
jgi:methionyl-tRNA formyltransferase